MSLNRTPRANSLHIGFFGRRNSGKSSLINAFTGQETVLVSEYAGTTTDPVYKSMEIYPIGPCVLIDTAGFDDEGPVGALRVKKTREAMEKTDLAIFVLEGSPLLEVEKEWLSEFKKKQIPVIPVLNKADLIRAPEAVCSYLEDSLGMKPIVVSSRTKNGLEQIITALVRNLPEDYDTKTITGGIVKDGELVLLVMPQDIQAPKGRLILPQVQTLRELLDKKCLVLCVTADKLEQALNALSSPPAVIITDSQVFKTVYEKKPAESKLTSFSVLFAAYKGDLNYYVKSAKAIDSLTENSKVLIAEACTHVPLDGDIGREKIPKLLREKVGKKITVELVRGNDFPQDLTGYDLIIHCGGCMFNRKYLLSRIERAARQGIPMTNYGVAIAHLTGILDKISLN
jgi:[FeFe] hydrogenase H-cluster maturation GTPase HydF